MVSPIGRFFRSPAARATLGLAAGLIVGIAIVASGSASARAAAVALEPIGTMWVNAIRMTIVPLVVSLLIASLGAESRSDAADAGSMCNCPMISGPTTIPKTATPARRTTKSTIA